MQEEKKTDQISIKQPTVSIMESKRQISDIENAIDTFGQNRQSVLGIKNRHITSGLIIDWKQFQDKGQVKSQLLVKDGQNQQRVIFSYVVQQWQNKQPKKIISRLIRKLPKPIPNQSVYLIQQQHIYRGSMSNYRKQGQGVYLIIKKYSDNTQRQRIIKGEWHQDLLRKGVQTDQNGNQQILSGNQIKISMKSKKNITPFLQKNRVVEEIRKKSAHLITSAKSIAVPSAHSINRYIRP